MQLVNYNFQSMEDYFIDCFAINLIKILPSLSFLAAEVVHFIQLPSEVPFPQNSNVLVL